MSFEENFFLNNNDTKEEKEHPNSVEYKRLLKERDELKQNIYINLKKMNFNSDEIKEVFMIIEKNYQLMEQAKQPLINVTPKDNLNKVEDDTKSSIKNISQNMLNELRLKVEEIKSRKR